MSLPVKIKSVIEALLFTESDCTSYINKKTGEIASISDAESEHVHQELDETIPEWIVAGIPRIKAILESDVFIEMPSQFELHEEKIMVSFCKTVEKEDVKNYLLKTLSGKAATENFATYIEKFDLHDSWTTHRNNAVKQVALDFLNSHNISFED